MSASLYWHDYETFGIDPARDRPVQFAGIRTNEDLEEIGEPLMIYCRPPNDYLPAPDACMVTGITPQLAMAEGMPEAKFIARINDEMSVPKTCTVGYNSIRFDDEVTRNTLYRNFFDAYAREWQGGNSRWDILDMLRACRALRPEGIHWPDHEDGKPSFRLEHLTAANGIGHEAAHDALSDVRATIAMAKLVKEKQPRLYEYLYQLRKKQAVGQRLNMATKESVLHVSGMYSTEYMCTTVIMPLVNHPTNNNGILVYDLRVDPTVFMTLDVEELRVRLFTKQAELGEGRPRLPVKTVHLNKCPVIAPIKTLDHAARERTAIDLEQAEHHRQQLLLDPAFAARVQEAFTGQVFDEHTDPDLMIYAGGFFSRDDKQQMDRIRTMSPADLAGASFPFDDRRLSEMLFRYRARNWPESLNEEETAQWDEHREHRIMEGGPATGLNLDLYFGRIEALRAEHDDPKVRQMLQQLEDYGHTLIAS